MMELVALNVPLRGVHRKHIMAWLRRSLRIGQQIGDFVLKMTIQRSGKAFEVRAQVRDGVGSFTCRSRGDLMDACREVTQKLNLQLHKQRLQRMAA